MTFMIRKKMADGSELFLTRRNTWVLPLLLDSAEVFPTREAAEKRASGLSTYAEVVEDGTC